MYALHEICRLIIPKTFKFLSLLNLYDLNNLL